MIDHSIGNRHLATVIGGVILAAATNSNIMQTGGYFSSHAGLVIALSLGVFGGARVVGTAPGKIALVIIAALTCGELYNFSATAERIVIERETQAAPLKDLAVKRSAALDRLHKIEASRPSSIRLLLAQDAKKTADKAVNDEAKDGCKRICKMKQVAAVEAEKELQAAIAEAQKLHQGEIETAKADVAANPLPASATPLADRLGWAPWALDLLVAGMLSLGANGLAGTLIAFGAHEDGSDKTAEQTFSEIKAEALKNIEPSPLVGLFAGELPDKPQPPRGSRKRRLPKGVIDFKSHPVVKALSANGGSVVSHRQLASLMQMDEGAASRRRKEVADRLDVTKVGKELHIALK